MHHHYPDNESIIKHKHIITTSIHKIDNIEHETYMCILHEIFLCILFSISELINIEQWLNFDENMKFKTFTNTFRKKKNLQLQIKFTLKMICVPYKYKWNIKHRNFMIVSE